MSIASVVVHILAKLRLHRLSLAWVNRWVKPYRQLNEPSYRVLCIGQAIFDEDVESLSRESERLLFIRYPRWAAKAFFRAFVPVGAPEANELKYHLLEAGSAPVQRYISVLGQWWPHFIERYQFDAILVANFPYSFQQELMRLCRRDGKAFIVLHKEGQAVAEQYRHYVKIYSTQRFKGHRILFCNQNIRQAVIDAGVDGITAENTNLVGQPRLDRYLDLNAQPPDGRVIVFFTFHWKDKFSYFVKDEKQLAALEKRSADFHRYLVRFAIEHPDFEVVIKSKASRFYLKCAEQLVHLEADEKPANVTITNKGYPFDLIKRAKVVLGHNSTALIEAAAAGRDIIIPDFSDILVAERGGYFDDFHQLARPVSSYEALEAEILRDFDGHVADAGKKREREEFLLRMIGFVDGRASERVCQQIEETIIEVKGLQDSGVSPSGPG